MACVLKLGLLAVAAASDPVEEVARNQTQLSRDNSTRNISAAQQAYIHEYADQYRDQYAPGGNQNNGQDSNYGQDSNWQRYVPANVRHYIPKTATQNGSNSSNSSNSSSSSNSSITIAQNSSMELVAQANQDPSLGLQGGDFSKFYAPYIPDVGGFASQYAGGSASQGGNYAQYVGGFGSQSSNYSHFYSQYLPQGVSPTMMAAQGGADYQKYMQGMGGQGQGSNYSHYYSQYMQQGGSSMGGASNYSQYMQQGGSSMGGASNYSQYMQQGGSPTMMVAQAQNKSGTGFQRYLDRYLPSGDGQYADSYTSSFSDQTASQESTGSTGPFGYDQYVDKYSAMAGDPSQGSNYSHFYSQYMPQGGSSMGGNYSNMFSQYMQQRGSPTMMAAQGGADYQKYMQQGGQGQGSSSYSQYMQQGGASGQGGNNSQTMHQSANQQQAQNKSGTGFQGYLERYLPPGDGHYADSHTSAFSDQSASQESTGSTGPHGYDQYVDRYSAMAGPHPSSGSDWHSQSASQSSAYQDAVGSHISGGGTGFLGGSAAANAPAAAVEAPAAATAQAPAAATAQASATAVPEVSLAASPTRSEAEASHWSSVQLVACIFAGFSLPASLAFLSTLRKSSRSLTDFEETGFQRLIEV